MPKTKEVTFIIKFHKPVEVDSTQRTELDSVYDALSELLDTNEIADFNMSETIVCKEEG